MGQKTGETGEGIMGKFEGMLLLSDYDNTLLYTEEALRDGTPRPLRIPRGRRPTAPSWR